MALANVAIPEPALGADVLAELRALTGADAVSVEHRDRVEHAAGKGYPDLIRLREGLPDGAPDAVVRPAGHDQIRAILDLCERRSIAVVPFGGGTSVVGGLAPLSGEHAGVISLDMGRMGAVLTLDRDSRTVTVQGGMRAPALESYLSARGLTLGHFPQSFEYVSLGGCAATRSAGQSSTGYGAIAEMVLGMRFAAPAADIELAAMPATAAGPDLRELIVGSEGTLGVISELSLRVRSAPVSRRYEGVFFEDFAAGTHALRMLSREHVLPDVARLSDEQETRLSLALAGDGGLKGRLGRAYIGARGMAEGCIAILGFEGSDADASFRRSRAMSLLRREGALPVGASPGRAWLHGRFEGPYLRDDLLTHGVMVETLETATPWSNVARLHGEVADAIAGTLGSRGTPALVMCHVSHVYESGCSLYFTFLARQREGSEIAQWREVKRAACEAIVQGGGTITHHHAVGRDHAEWMQREISAGGVQALRALKSDLDPAGIMNPGKLLRVSPEAERAAQDHRARVGRQRLRLAGEEHRVVFRGVCGQQRSSREPLARGHRRRLAHGLGVAGPVVEPYRVEEAFRGREVFGGDVERFFAGFFEHLDQPDAPARTARGAHRHAGDDVRRLLRVCSSWRTWCSNCCCPTRISTAATTMITSAPSSRAPPSRELWPAPRRVPAAAGAACEVACERGAARGRGEPSAAGISGRPDGGAIGASSEASALAHSREGSRSADLGPRPQALGDAGLLGEQIVADFPPVSGVRPRAWAGASTASAACARSCTALSGICSRAATSA